MEREEIINTTRKAVKNPFAKIHQTASANDGTLSDETRNEMMKDAIRELRDNIQKSYNTEINDIVKIAEFYGFRVFVDNTFSGKPQVVIDYEDDNIVGVYDIEQDAFEQDIFPDYLVKVLNEWIADNRFVLKEMWAKKKIISIPEWV